MTDALGDRVERVDPDDAVPAAAPSVPRSEVPGPAVPGPAATEPAGVEELTRQVEQLRSRFPGYSRWFMWFLLGVGVIDGAGNTVLNAVIEDIKLEFGVSDIQIGYLSAAYSVVAALSVLPFGYLADRFNRVRLIAFGFLPWALAMFLTGGAQSFAMMFGARLFLGTIEATNGPATPSLLGDYYQVKERGRVLGLFRMGGLVGAIVGIVFAGLVSQFFGWRMAFFVWGVIGLLCAGVIVKVLPEPRRGIPDALDRAERRLAEAEGIPVEPAPDVDLVGDGIDRQIVEQPVIDQEVLEARVHNPRPARDFDYRKISVRTATREIFGVRTLWIMFVAGLANDFFMTGISTWAVTFFRRHHDLSAGLAAAMVPLGGAGIVVGVIVGARLADRYFQEGKPENRIKLGVIGNIGAGLLFAPAFYVDSLPLAVLLLIAGGFFFGLPWAPDSAVQLDILVPHLRGRASAVRSLLRIGSLAISPIVFGALSDAHGLRTAFVVLAPTLIVTGLILRFAVATYQRDLLFTQSESHRQFQLEDAEEQARLGTGVAADEAPSDPDDGR